MMQSAKRSVMAAAAFARPYFSCVTLLAPDCGAASRSGLYNLGLTDEEIDAKDTVVLAFDVIVARTRLADAAK